MGFFADLFGFTSKLLDHPIPLGQQTVAATFNINPVKLSGVPEDGVYHVAVTLERDQPGNVLAQAYVERQSRGVITRVPATTLSLAAGEPQFAGHTLTIPALRGDFLRVGTIASGNTGIYVLKAVSIQLSKQ